MPTLPTITVNEVTNEVTQVVASWVPYMDPSVTGYVLLVNDPARGQAGKATLQGATQSNGTVPLMFTPGEGSTLTISAVNGSQNVAQTDTALLTAVPTIEGLDFDGTRLYATWQDGDEPEIPITGHVLKLVNAGSKQTQTRSVRDPSTSAGSLQPRGSIVGKAYQFTVNAATADVTDAQPPLVDVFTSLPTFRAVNYDGAQLTATWQPAGAGEIDQRLAIWQSGQRSSAQVSSSLGAAASAGTLSAPSLDPSVAWRFAVRSSADGVVGSSCPAVALLVALPQVDDVEYDGDVTLHVSWTFTPGAVQAEGFDVSVLNGDGDAVQSESVGADARSATLTLGEPLDESQDWAVEVRASASGGQVTSSGTGEVLVEQLEILEAIYEQDRVVVCFTPSQNPGVQGYVIELLDDGVQVARRRLVGEAQEDGTLVGWVGAPHPLPPLSVRVRGLGRGGGGPVSALVPLVSERPEVLLVRTQADAAEVTLDEPGCVQLFMGSQPSGDPVMTVGNVASIPQALPAVQTWSVRARRVQGVAVGPPSPKVRAIAGAVEMGVAEVGDAQTRVRWQAVRDPGVKGYRVDYSGGSVLTDHCTVSLPVTAGSVQVTPLGDNAEGLPSAPVSLLSQAPSALQVQYADGVLQASWGAVEGATGYRAELRNGLGDSVRFSCPTPALSVSRHLPETAGYSLQVAAVHERCRGPWSDGAPVVTQVPTITSVTVSSTAVLVSVDAGAVVTLSADGAASISATSAGGEATLTLSAPLDPTKRWSARAAFANGPSSAATPVIAGIPRITSTWVEATGARVTWTPVEGPGVRGYRVDHAGGSELVEGDTALIDSSSGEVTVTAMGGISAGAVSAPQTLLSSAPAAQSASYDGAFLRLSWSAVSGARLYTVFLDEQGGGVRRCESLGTQLTLPVELNAGTQYKVYVNASDGVNTGPVGDAVLVETRVPTITSVTTSASAVTVSVDPTAVVTLSAEGAAPITATSEGGTATLSLSGALDPTKRWSARAAYANGPSSAATPVIAGIPRITSTSVEAPGAKVSWTAVEGPGVRGYRVDYAGGSKVVEGTTALIPATSGSVTVTALGGVSVGPASGPQALLSGGPAVQTVSYDGAFLRVSWDAVDGARLYQVLLDDKDGGIHSYQSLSTSLTLPVELSADTEYKVYVQASDGINTGPVGDALSVETRIPTITSVTTSASAVAVQAGDGAVVTLTADGAAPVQASSSGGVATLSLSAPLDPTKRWSARAAYPNGPSSGATPVIAGIPHITSTSVEASGARVSWAPVEGPGVRGYRVAYEGDSEVVEGTTARIPATSGSVTVTALGGVSVGPASEALTLLSGAPTPQSASYDGAFLHLSWSAVAGARLYTVFLDEQNGGIRRYESLGTQLTLPVELDADVAYKAYVQASDGINTGPVGDALSVETRIPTITSVTTSASDVTVSVDAGTLVTLSAEGAAPTSATADADGVATLALDAPLDPTKRWSARAAYPNGPSSGATPVIAGIPHITSTSVEASGARVSWAPVEGPGVRGYRVAYDGDSEVVEGTTARIPATSGSVTVTALGGVSLGPASEAQTLLSGAPTLQSASYDGAFLHLSWSAVAGARLYTVFLDEQNGGIRRYESLGTQLTLPVELDADVAYKAYVQASDGINTGPVGDALPVETRIPTIMSVTTSSSDVTVSVDPTAVVTLSAEGAAPTSATADADGVATLSLSAPLDPTKRWSARAAYPNGPSSGATPVIAGIPHITSTSVEASGARVSWTPVEGPGVRGYRVAYDGDSEVVEGTTARIPATSGSVTVTALGGVSLGPASEAQTLFGGAPTPQSASYDGAFLHLSWSAVAGARLYTVFLDEQNGGIRRYESLGTQLTLPVELDADVAYKAYVQASDGINTGPVGDALSVETRIPTITSVTTSTSDVTVSVDPTAVVTLSAEGAAPVSASADGDGVATLSLSAPLDPTKRWSARAAYPNGPSSGATPVIAGIPHITSTSVEASGARVSWTPVEGPGVRGYRVAYDGDSEVVEGTTARIPATSGSVTVTALGGVSLGSASEAQTLLSGAPAVQSVSYDGGLLRASWGAVDTADTYRLQVLEDGAVVRALETSALAASVAVRLGEASTSEVRLRAVAGVNAGPSGVGAPVETRIPTITSVTTTSTEVTVSADMDAVVTVSAEGEAPITATAAGGAATLTLAAPLDPTKRWSARAASPNGPSSRPTPVIAGAPSLLSTSVGDGGAALRWTPVQGPGVRGYRVDYAGGSEVVEGTSAQISASSGAVSVTALGDLSVGPTGAAQTLLSEAPVVQSASYDGVLLNVSWSEVDGADTYLLQVLEDGAVARELRTSALSVSVAVALSEAATCAVQLRAQAGLNQGPFGASAPVEVRAPSVTAVQCAGDSVTAAVDAGAAAWLVVNGVASGSPTPASSGAVTLTLPGDLTPTDRVAVSAAFPGGPAARPVGVIRSAPALRLLEVEDGAARLAWGAAPEPEVSGYLVSYGDAQTAHVVGTEAEIPAVSGAVAVSALGPNTAGPSGAAVSPLLDAPSVQSVSYDGQLLSLTWSEIDGAEAYEIVLNNGAQDLAPLRGTGGALDAPAALSGEGSYTLTVRALAGVSRGPTSASAAVPTQAGVLTAFRVDASALRVSTAQGTSVTLYQSGQPYGEPVVAGPDGAQFDGPFSAFKEWTARGRVSEGPPSAPLRILTQAPLHVQASYDGQRVSARWSPSPLPEVVGYAVYLKEEGGSGPVEHLLAEVSGDAAEAAFTLTLDRTWSVFVRAQTAFGEGPPSEAADPLSDATGWSFPSTEESLVGFVYRADIRDITPPDPTDSPPDVVLSLPQLFGAALDTPISVGAFTLSASGGGDPKLPLSASVAGADAWTFHSPGVREGLWADFQGFLEAVEGSAAGVLPGGLAALRAAVSRALPSTFAETLAFAYGLRPALGVVDLVPELRLRLRGQAYQLVGPAGTEAGLNGFVGVGAELAGLVMRRGSGGWALELDAFLGLLAGEGLPAIGAGEGGAGGVIDLSQAAFQLPWMRLVYPTAFPASSGPGSVSPAQNVVLLAAATYAALNAATAQFMADRSLTSLSGAVGLFFRGRTAPVPELVCALNGEAHSVPMGSTVRQLLSRQGALPPLVDAQLTGLTLRRDLAGLFDAGAPLGAAVSARRSEAVRFADRSLSAQTWADGSDLFELPLLAGDRLDLER